MSLRRLLASLINMILGFINLILVIANIGPIGSILFNINYPSSRKGKLLFGLMSLIQWIIFFTIIGTIITIYFWVVNKPSIATRFYNAIK